MIVNVLFEKEMLMNTDSTKIIIVEAEASRRKLNLVGRHFSRLEESIQITTRITMILLTGLFLVGPTLAEAEMNLDNTLSDEAQLNTIAFDGLAFLTGSLGADSFFPPGKVADFWGFQYLRDNDPSNMGHNTDFLTRAANNMLYILTTSVSSSSC